MIREAMATDAAAIASVHVRTWQQAYRGLIPDTYLDRIDADERRRRWLDIIDRADACQQVVLVAEENELIVGFATGGACRDEEPAAEAELYAIYVEPSSWGTGVADELISALLSTVSPGDVSLWVLAHNTRARGFYARHGFSTEGARRVEEFDGVAVEEVRLVRPAR